MRLGDNFMVHWMSRSNGSLWLWLDVKIGQFWYVLMWRKKHMPYMYRSRDATPPSKDNDGVWIFGQKSRGHW